MGNASENPDHSLERVRPGKANRESNTRYTGNLIAFRHAADRPVGRPVIASSAANASNAHPDNSNLPPAIRSIGVERTKLTSASSANTAISAQNASGAVPASKKSALALAIIGSLSAGALLGSIWPFFNLRTDAQPVASTAINDVPSAVTTLSARAQGPDVQPGPSTQIQSNAAELDQPPQQADITRFQETLPVAQADDLAEPLEDPVDTLAKQQYLVEIDWLIGQNVELQQDVETLSSETLVLNQELLDMELQVASLNAEAEAEKRTIFNYVNVGIGSDFTSLLEANNAARGGDDDAFVPPEAQEIYYDAPSSDEDVPAPHSQQAPVNQDTFSGQGEPAYHLDTGIYIDQQFIADVYQYEQGAQVAYDPETGFYVNPAFVEDQDGEEFFESNAGNSN